MSGADSFNTDSVMQKPPQSNTRPPSSVVFQDSSSRVTAPEFDRQFAKGKIIDIECDGNKTLLEQQAAINFAEQTNNVQLICYQKSTAPNNLASVKQVPKGQTILPLLLIELPASTSVGAEVAVQLASGRHLVFYTMIHVKGAETKVAGFR
jgi:hypothetical protein